ncbi:enoyl-CoA hydratase/isomerase family protein [Marivibrio halodurans]|uniref:Enoyl-CoA hydratase/isomerase family protein n=1 Tax=Marivibrio halodurans TaxID=2039722 RepID=A0A8J7RZK6_9PROT|nr:enoyl-CoA hydratase-related protein [Marivibrio halodurans]MBP5857495.1 enoyl-CoA hydratase/isomerase family protein [Marivibrio halodurans]
MQPEGDKDDAPPVRVQIAEGLARVTLDRPHRLNAISIDMANRLTALWEDLDADEAVRVILLDAAECDAFCAGMDLKEMHALRAAGDDPLARMTDPFQNRMRAVAKPIVCALSGDCHGAGVLLAMGADIRVGVAGARMAISEARFGRGTGWAVPLLWMVPQPILAEMTMTGNPVSMERLARHGFINHLEPDADAVRARARAIAERIAANAPLSVRAAKASLAAGMDLGCAAGLARAAEIHRPVYASADASEGARAFAEKRAPRWTGR